jgi:CheY-like chemotaxis protein
MIDRSLHSVLVVDDNASSRYATSRTLRAAGFNTVEASAGAEALELVEFVSAVVLDVHLPDLLGFEVCRLMRSRAATASLPVVHVSRRVRGRRKSRPRAWSRARMPTWSRPSTPRRSWPPWTT